jgi:rhodanese-related sulfurtransferase
MRVHFPANKEATIFLQCVGGHRSTTAMAILGRKGSTDVRTLKGEFGGWVSEG